MHPAAAAWGVAIRRSGEPARAHIATPVAAPPAAARLPPWKSASIPVCSRRCDQAAGPAAPLQPWVPARRSVPTHPGPPACPPLRPIADSKGALPSTAATLAADLPRLVEHPLG